jgi:hypothetical protein
MGFWKRIRRLGPASRAQREHDIEREIRNHLDLEAEESGPHGARRAFGNVTLVKEDVRAAWGWPRLEELAQDVRISFRMLRRNPGFALTAVLVLALGLRWLEAPWPGSRRSRSLVPRPGPVPTCRHRARTVRRRRDR